MKFDVFQDQWVLSFSQKFLESFAVCDVEHFELLESGEEIDETFAERVGQPEGSAVASIRVAVLDAVNVF